MKKLKVQLTEDGDAFLELEDFKDMVDITLVKQYTIEAIDDGGTRVLMLSFYDADGDIVECK